MLLEEPAMAADIQHQHPGFRLERIDNQSQSSPSKTIGKASAVLGVEHPIE
jgi:ABC-type hemin transport system ATPase subunit